MLKRWGLLWGDTPDQLGIFEDPEGEFYRVEDHQNAMQVKALELMAVQSELAELQASLTPQPIETAPKVGKILLRVADEFWPYVVAMWEEAGCGWWDGDDYLPPKTIIGWLPLPPEVKR